jgi:spermidine synthase
LTLLVLLFGSGACAVVYQVLWLRELSLVFGVTVYAACTVLTAFMGGLALGSVLAGPALRWLGKGLLAFGLAEILVGVSALSSRPLLAAAESVYHAVQPASDGVFAGQTAVRFLAAAAVLIVPTTMMGLTLPLVSASAAVRASLGPRLSLVYAANTAGGVVGCLAAGFVGIPSVGVRGTFMIAAAVNAVIGLTAVALVLSGAGFDRGDGDRRTDGGPPVSAERPAHPRALALVVGLSGAAAMGLEVAWFRALVQFVASTTYAFSTMLATVLAGLALGGAVAVWMHRRNRDGLGWLIRLQGATAVGILSSLAVLAFAYDRGWADVTPAGASVLAILPATICMGASLPLALGLAVAAGTRADAVAASIGRLYAVNLSGAIVGAILTGFVFVPWLGVRTTVIAAATVYLVNAALLAGQARPAARAGVLAFAVVATGLAVILPDPLESALGRRHGRDLRPYWREEGAQATVSVREAPGRRVLFIDGLHQASDNPAMVRIHRVIGHLAMVLHRNPQNVLVIGLGGGATAGVVTQYPGARLHVVELSDSVRRAASLFAHVNYGVTTRPDIRIHREDARTFLASTANRFDVITADIIQPTHAGAGGLYSREYFQRVRDRLEPGGLVLQWVGQREVSHYQIIVRTFMDVFPETVAWVDGTLLVGTIEPLRLSESAFERRLEDDRTRQALDAIGLTSFTTLAHWFTADASTIRRFVGSGPVLTDDRPLVEYYRSLPPNEPLIDLSRLRSDVQAIIAP